MQYIVNATFIINVLRTDIGIMENMEVITIKEVLEETTYELGIKIDDHVNIKSISTKTTKEKLKVPSAKRRLLSAIDVKLLNVAYAGKKNCILVTDDKQVRIMAKSNYVRSYTTPQYIAYLIKNNMIEANEGVSFLNKLRRTYIRPKDIDAVLKRIKKWR